MTDHTPRTDVARNGGAPDISAFATRPDRPRESVQDLVQRLLRRSEEMDRADAAREQREGQEG